MKNNMNDKLYKHMIWIIDNLKDRIEKDPYVIAFGDVNLMYVDDNDVLNDINHVALMSSMEGYYNRANYEIKHLYFNRALANYRFLFDQARMYKQIPIEYLIGFAKLLLYLNEILLCYDFSKFLYFSITNIHKEYETEAAELLDFIKEIEVIFEEMKNSKDTTKLKAYIENKIINKENILYKDDKAIINEIMNIEA